MDARKKKPACPLCGSKEIVPIVHGYPGPELEKEARKGKVVLGDCMDWEGQPKWHCKNCACEWRGNSTKFIGWKNRKQ